MKSLLQIEVDGQDRDAVLSLLHEHGYAAREVSEKTIDARLLLTQYCVDTAPVDISLLEPPTARIIYANETMCRNLGYTSEELLARTALDLDPSLTVERVAEFERRFAAGDSIPPFETVHRRKDGTLFPIENVLKRITFAGLDVVMCFAQDISKRKQAETMLKEQLHFLQQLLDSIPVPVFFKDAAGYYLGCNSAFESFFSLSRSQVVGKNVYEIAPKELADLYSDHDVKLLRNPGMQIYEAVIEHSDGSLHDVIFNKATYVDSDRRVAGIVGAIVDITERKNVEKCLQASLAEKEVLLKEVHHRVKNNLQIVCSLLDMQSESIADLQLRSYFLESQNRIRSMALIHERLYGAKDFASIDFDEYVRDLSRTLFESYVVDSRRINLQIDACKIFLDIDRAIPCGLIINELVSNSLKHAFPAGRSGEISIRISADAEGWLTLEIADTGVGLPAGFDFRNAGTLGLELVNMLTRQLQGEVARGQGAGTRFIVRFPDRPGR